MKTYSIADNGGTPFLVDVDKHEKTVEIWKQATQSEPENADDYVKLKKMSYEDIYIGKDPKNFTDQMGETWEKSFEGNSILLKISDKKFVFIGWDIYSFELEDGDEIKNYYSPMGHSGVPYPYLIGKKNTYFMIEKQYAPNELLDLTKEAYRQFYDTVNASKKQSMKKMNIIQERIW
jgi:hypothetical protein